MTQDKEDDYSPIHLNAYMITRTHIYVKCPYCYTRYNKDGKPSKSSKNYFHIHGSGGDLSNRIETRGHDGSNEFYKQYNIRGEFYIHITDDTPRTNMNLTEYAKFIKSGKN